MALPCNSLLCQDTKLNLISKVCDRANPLAWQLASTQRRFFGSHRFVLNAASVYFKGHVFFSKRFTCFKFGIVCPDGCTNGGHLQVLNTRQEILCVFFVFVCSLVLVREPDHERVNFCCGLFLWNNFEEQKIQQEDWRWRIWTCSDRHAWWILGARPGGFQNWSPNLGMGPPFTVQSLHRRFGSPKSGCVVMLIWTESFLCELSDTVCCSINERGMKLAILNNPHTLTLRIWNCESCSGVKPLNLQNWLFFVDLKQMGKFSSLFNFSRTKCHQKSCSYLLCNCHVDSP